MAARALLAIFCNLVPGGAFVFHQLSLRAAAPLEGLVSKPVVEDLPLGPGECCCRRNRRQRRHRRRSVGGPAFDLVFALCVFLPC